MRGVAKIFRQVRPPYHWRLSGALLLSALPSILQNQGKNEVLPVLPLLPPKAPLYYMQPNYISSSLMQG